MTIDMESLDTVIVAKSSTSAAAIKKKLNKKKNKSKGVSETATIENDHLSTVHTKSADCVNNDEIQAVSEELLKRLQINGGIHTKMANGDNTNYTTTCKSKSEPKSLKEVNSANYVGQKGQPNACTNSKKNNKNNNNNNINNNNNNSVSDKNNHCKQSAHGSSNTNGVDINGEDTEDSLPINQCNKNQSHLNRNLVNDDELENKQIRNKTSTNSGHQLPDLSSDMYAPSSSSQILDRTSQIETTHHSIELNDVHVASTSARSSDSSSPTTISTGVDTTSSSATSIASMKSPNVEILFKEYENELQMPDIMRVIQKDLSEPYSIYTYRYFIHNWPKLCFLAMDGDNCIGAIVCKLDIHRQMTKRGYIAMLAVDKDYRKLKVGTTLVQKAIEAMLEHNADEVVLETEITNIPALRLYENLGFVRDKRLFDYYLNGVDALRLKLWFK